MTGPSGGVVFSRRPSICSERVGPCRSRQATLARGFQRSRSFQLSVPGAQPPYRRNLLRNRLGVARPPARSRSLRGWLSSRILSLVCSMHRGLSRPILSCPTSSPFFYPVIVDLDAITCSKIEFAEAVRAEGIDLNPHYRFVVSDWPYIRPYLADDFNVPNAQHLRSLVQPISERKLRRAGSARRGQGDHQGLRRSSWPPGRLTCPRFGRATRPHPRTRREGAYLLHISPRIHLPNRGAGE